MQVGGVGDRTENLFNKDTVTVNSFVVQNIATLSYSAASNASDYIPIENATEYTLSWLCETLASANNRNVGVYDANKNAIETFQVAYYGKSSLKISLDTPNAAYIRFTIDKNMSNVMLNSGSTALPYEPYGYKVPVVVNGKNLFDESSELNTNSTMDLSTGTFPGSTGDNKRTFFFKAKPNTTYTFSCDTIGDRLVICEYNRIINPSDYSTSHKLTPNIKTFSQTSGISEYSFTTSSTTKMVGIYYSLNTLPTSIQIEIGDTATTYEEYTSQTTNIYLDEPIEENESISLSDTNVNIPTIKGTNVLTVDTEVQPSKVLIKVGG